MDTQKIASEKQSNIANTEAEQYQNIINNKQESYQQESYQQEKPQRKKSGGCPISQQFIFDCPMTDRPISVSDVLEEKVTFSPKPIERSNDKKEKKEVQRLSTTDSMQEFLEIPDYLPGNDDWENSEEGT